MGSDYLEGLISEMRAIHNPVTSFKRGKAQRPSSRQPSPGAPTGGPDRKLPGLHLFSGGATSPPLAINRRLFLPILALLAALAVTLLFLLPGAFVQAQGAEQSFTFAENGDGPVATFTASDPEGVSPIVWSLLDDAMNEQNLGIFTDGNNDGVDDSADDVMPDDIADVALFAINQNGVLTFMDPPDFETPVGGTADDSNTYQVVVQASDGGVGSFVNWFKVTVTVTDMEEAGMLVEWAVDADGNGTAETPPNLLQFQPEAILTVVAPTDSDGPTPVTNVRWQWYRSASKSEMGTAIEDAEAATYTVSDTSTSDDVGMYLRVVATYSDRRGPNKTASYVSENPVQAARDDNTAPEFALTTETRVVSENSTGNVGSPLRATDDDGDILTYSIVPGGDGASFGIERATGQLTVAGLDFEDPADTGDDNEYVVTVKATDSHGVDTVANVTVTITVNDVNEVPTFGAVDGTTTPPTNTMGMAADHREDNEGDALNIATYTASDPEGGDTTLSLMGDDAALFELADDTLVTGATANNVSQVLSFMEMPDFEMPGDQNEDNVYEVTVRASDGVLYADRMVTVKVTDADEEGEVELSSQDAMIGIELTAEIVDSDGGAPDSAQFIDQVWTWHRLETAATTITDDTAIAGATSSKYTPVGDDRGTFLRAMVSYTDRTRDENNMDDDNTAAANFVGFMNTATSDATTRVRNNPDNQSPVFAEGTTAVRLVEENTKALTADSGNEADDDDEATTDNPADNVGGTPVVAMDADGDTLNYALSGRDKDMFRLRANGQIEVSDKAELNYEASRTHTVTITADDGLGESTSITSITVNIHVTDLDEKPTISDRADSSAMAEQTVEYAEDGTGPVIRLTASDPEGVTPIVWSLLQNAGDEQNLGIVQVPEVADDVADGDIADRALFEISQNGELTFADSPSFEAISSSGDDSYQVVVQASDGGVDSHVNWFKVTVNVTDVEELGTVTEWTIDPDGTETEEDAGQELLQFNASAVLTVLTPTDGDDGVANVQWQWYRSTSRSSQGTEIGLTDSEGNTVITTSATGSTYTVQDTPLDPNDLGRYIRVVASYSDRRGPNKTASFVALNPVQAPREADNTEPEFSAPSVARRITEAMDNVGATVRATDADRGDILTYSIATGGDNDSFEVDRATGQLTVAADGGLDFENPTDAGDTANNNTYVVTVTATDSSGGSGTAEVTITVADVNEVPTFGAVDGTTTPPTNTMGMAADHREDNEGDALNIATYTASDPEGGDTTLSLMGDDAALFELADDTLVTGATANNVSQVLSFMEMPDFEMPGDRNRDNVYEVTVRASSGGLYADRMVTVKVTDADEEGEVELSTQNAVVGIELTATLTDSDSGAPDPARFIDQVWTWHRLETAATTITDDTAIAGATSSKYTPVADDREMFLRAMVSYTDRTRDENNMDDDNTAAANFVGFMNTATSDATTAVLDNPANQAPVFAEGAKTVRLVEENTKALTATTGDDANDDALADDQDNPDDNVGGGPVVATDADAGDTVIHTLGGPDMDMFRLRDNGQIEVSDKADLDYEDSASHTVTITATDSSGAANNSTTIEVTIHVTDLDERPVISAEAAGAPAPANNAPAFAAGTYTRAVAENMAAGRNIGSPVAATDADNDDLSYTLGGADGASFAIAPATGQLMTKATLDHETKPSYTVTVTATDGDGATDTITVTITVTDVDEPVEPVEPVIPGDTNADGMIDKTEVIAAFRAYVADPSDKAEMIAIFRQYVRDAAGSQ